MSVNLQNIQTGVITPPSSLPPIRPPRTSTNEDWKLQSINTSLTPLPKIKSTNKSKYIVDLPSTTLPSTSTISTKTTTKSTSKSRKQRNLFSQKLRAIEKQRILRCSNAKTTHEKNMQQHRHQLFRDRTIQTEREKTVSFEFTQRLQSISQSNFSRLSTLDTDHRRKQSSRDRNLIRNLSKARELLAVKAGAWDELHDPETGTVYYFDCSTGHSQWERPSEMDATSKEVGLVTCAICLDVCEYPTSCRNGHLYCTECLRSHLEVSHNRTCPTCRVVIEGDGVRNMLAEDLVLRLKKSNQHLDNANEKRNSEEIIMKKHQREIEEDCVKLELAKRALSRELQHSCKELRTTFENEWSRMVEEFNLNVDEEHVKLNKQIELYENVIQSIEKETNKKIEMLEKQFGIQKDSVLSMLWGGEENRSSKDEKSFQGVDIA